MPQGGLKALEDAEGDMDKLLAIKADQYDLVVNGYESASGAVRNHDPEIMVKAFEMVGLGEADVKAKFPAMYNAFTYGAPLPVLIVSLCCLPVKSPSGRSSPSP